MGIDATIELTDGGRTEYATGESVTGTATVTLPDELGLLNLALSFHCIGEVKWIEYPRTPAWMDGNLYNEEVKYLELDFSLNEKDVKIENGDNSATYRIPFRFDIPRDQNLPSSLHTKQGHIRYFVELAVKHHEDGKVEHFHKDVTVAAPIDKNLMITVGGSGEKVVLFHHGTVAVHASLDRKGYTAGDHITVHLSVDNKTNVSVRPQAVLQQVAIYMSGVRHKTVEQTVTETPVTGPAIEPHTDHQSVTLEVPVPDHQQLSIKSTVITVKYFVHLTVDIPHSLDLHVNLPVVITTRKVIEALAGEVLQNSR